MPVKVANILQYFIESIALQANYVTVVEDRTISTKYFLPLLAKTGPSCSAVSAIAELLVITSLASTPCTHNHRAALFRDARLQL